MKRGNFIKVTGFYSGGTIWMNHLQIEYMFQNSSGTTTVFLSSPDQEDDGVILEENIDEIFALIES